VNRLTISITLLFVLVSAIYLPGLLETEKQVPISEQEEAWQPNYQAKGMLSTLYDANGKISHQVYADKMEHYQLLGFTLFQQPKYTIFVENQREPWQVTALEGTLYEDNRIQLETDVIILSQDEQGIVQTINTEFLEINLSSKTLSSDQPVSITGSDYVINSNGLSANLETRQYELIDHVQTIYAPNR
jgi:lipopolysaccharide export system protein LptC